MKRPTTKRAGQRAEAEPDHKVARTQVRRSIEEVTLVLDHRECDPGRDRRLADGSPLRPTRGGV